MKTPLLLTSVLLSLMASLASAAPGLDAGWVVPGIPASGCPANANSLSGAYDSCDNNAAAPHTFVLSVKAPAGITQWVGEEFAVDVQTSVPILPDWWHLEAADAAAGIPAGCRDGSFNFSTLRGIGPTTTCKDYWGSTPQPGRTAWIPNLHAGHTRLVGAFARPVSEATAITTDVYYYVGSGTFDSNHAVAEPGVASCDGCQIPGCLIFLSLKIIQPAGAPGGDVIITHENIHRTLGWNVGVYPMPIGCYPTPARRSTWGQVKSLYR